jgi:hypothetical protein
LKRTKILQRLLKNFKTNDHVIQKAIMQALSIFIYLLSVGFAACDSASLVWNEASNSYSYKAGWVPGAMAYGKLVNAINETGFVLTVNCIIRLMLCNTCP